MLRYTMKDPNIKTMVVHSQSKSAWNVIGTRLGGKYKIARVPYECCDNEDITSQNRAEAFEHASFISYSFHYSKKICENDNVEQMTKLEAIEYLVENELHTSEWKGAAMYLGCRKIITSSKTSFTKDELDEILRKVKNS